MDNPLATEFLTAKRDFNHAVCEAIKEAANRFQQQTGITPAAVSFRMEFDCSDGRRLEYVLKDSSMDFRLDEVC